MSFDVGAFRTSFPEFASAVAYPDPMIDMWAGLAERQVRLCIWKDSTTLGRSLYVAHQIALAAQDVKAAQIGGSPGATAGIANAKTVGSVTVGYDAASTTEEDAGWWNQTTYGKNFIRLARIFGAGAIQL